jgi:hypothetical protein
MKFSRVRILSICMIVSLAGSCRMMAPIVSETDRNGGRCELPSCSPAHPAAAYIKANYRLTYADAFAAVADQELGAWC